MKKNKINIRFVQLEPAAFLSDVDVQTWNATEIGCYWMILLYLYTNNGKAPNDLKLLSRLCHCDRNFKRIWNKIAHKFDVAGAFLSNVRVSCELRNASDRFRKTHLAGVKGAKSRWQTHSDRNADAIAKESKGKVIEGKEIKNSNSKPDLKGKNAYEDIHQGISKDTISTTKNNSSFSTSVLRRTPYGGDKENPFLGSLEAIKNRTVARASSPCNHGQDGRATEQTRVLQFSEKLNALIRPRTQSDRTCFRKVANFFAGQIAAGKCGSEIFTRALHFAEEAAKGRNPAACFMALVKKELNYR